MNEAWPKESISQPMEDDDDKAILVHVFGESSDSEQEEQGDKCVIGADQNGAGRPSTDGSRKKNPTWEPIGEVKGLWVCRDFLSPSRQSSLLSAILNEGWFVEASKNQAMRFGDLPSWAIQLSDSIHEVAVFGGCVHEDVASKDPCLPLPAEIIRREPLFDQLIVNVYQPGEGICAHVDLMRFEDGIAIISLESTCVMDFSQVGVVGDDGEEQASNTRARVPVILSPGSLILMSGEARYSWKHEINRKPGFQVWNGQELKQERRISITMRKLLADY